MLTSWSTPFYSSFGGSPCTMLRWTVGRCTINVYVLHDKPRVVIMGDDLLPRDADVVEVEALAERFNSDELRAAAARMRAAG